jgi:hypothetical protein
MGWTRRAPPQPAASGGVRRDSSACLAQRNMLGSPRLIIQRAVTRLTRSGGSRPELRLLRCRSSSGNSLYGQNSAGFRESARPFKGIICDDISEFESYHPSQAVRSLWTMSGLQARPGPSCGTITFDRAVISYNGDFVIHFHHPTWRDDQNDPATATRVNERKVR